MSQSIILYLAAPLRKPEGSPGKVRSVPVYVLLQRVAQPPNTRWNLFTCHCQSTSEVRQTDKHPESHVTTHLLLILNVYLEAPIWRKCLFIKTAKRYSRGEQISLAMTLILWLSFGYDGKQGAHSTVKAHPPSVLTCVLAGPHQGNSNLSIPQIKHFLF